MMTPQRHDELFEIAERMAKVLDELARFAEAEQPGAAREGVSWIRDEFERTFQIWLNARWNSPRHPLHAEIKAAVMEEMAREEVCVAIGKIESNVVTVGAAVKVDDLNASTGACRAAPTRRKAVTVRRRP